MSESTVITEFGSSKIAMGLTGEGVPLKVWSSIDRGFLVSRMSNNHSTINKNSNFLRPSHRSMMMMKNSDEFLLLDIESFGLGNLFLNNNQNNNHPQLEDDGEGINNNTSSSFMGQSLDFISSSFQLKQKVFCGGGEIKDPQIAGHLLRQMMTQTHYIESPPDNMTFLPTIGVGVGGSSSSSSSFDQSSLFDSDSVFNSWAETIFESGVNGFFPLRPAVAATIESGRQNAVVLDCGHSAARINVVVDGIQRIGKVGCVNNLSASIVECGGAALSKEFEEELFGCYQRQQQHQQQVSKNGNHQMKNKIENSNNQNDNNDGDEDVPLRTDASEEEGNEGSSNGNNKIKSLMNDDKLSFGYFPWLLLSSSSASASQSPFGIYSRGKIVQEAKHSCGIIWNPHSQQQQMQQQNHRSSNQQHNNNNNNNSKNITAMDQLIKPAIYNSPNGTQVGLLGSNRSKMFEKLFTSASSSSSSSSQQSQQSQSQQQQQSPSSSSKSLVDLIVRCYHDLPAEYRQSTPLIIVGGTARTEGFATRLAAELAIVDTAFQHMPPRYPQDPYSQWRGASFVCSTPSFIDSSSASSVGSAWITREKLEEHGVARVRAGLP